jgi:hypothetical protein
MEKWKRPPIEKVYEALGALADGRIEIEGHTAKAYSSTRNKCYAIAYDPDKKAIMLNDNASFYQDYLGYPGIAFLLLFGEISYRNDVAELLRGIPWKDLNKQFRNNFRKTVNSILEQKTAAERALIESEVSRIYEELCRKEYFMLGPKMSPPEGY